MYVYMYEYTPIYERHIYGSVTQASFELTILPLFLLARIIGMPEPVEVWSWFFL